METIKYLLCGLLMGIIVASAGFIYNERSFILTENEKLIVTDINRGSFGWTYEMRTLDHMKFTIEAQRVLGYGKNDTLTFFGKIPQCKDKPNLKQNSVRYARTNR